MRDALSSRARGVAAAAAAAAVIAVILMIVLLVRSGAIGTRHPSPPPAGAGAARGSVTAAAAEHVGRGACAECHPEETKLFEGSDHDLAMQPANEQSVLADFSGSAFEHQGVTSTFFRRDGKYFVNTEGADAEPADFEVAYAFGVYPLQQYLVALPGGRYQALTSCWDSRSKQDGGQRWFPLHPTEPAPAGDILHWTGPAQNWNFSCAECHSTNLRKQWSTQDDRYATTWSEIDVSCEACHGPGSAHVAWARSEPRAPGANGLVADLRKGPGSWIMDPVTGIAQRDQPLASRAESEACARCHARRSTLFEDHVPGRPLLDTHRLSLLDEGLYHADGQQQDEVYEAGSFLQSRMYAKGVTCSDCHDPHGVRRVADPDSACARCHLPSRFGVPGHHHHQQGSKGASCVECHAPVTIYMGVDARRDHSFRVPRPDLSEKLGTPNACTGCHADRPLAWAAEAVRGWYPQGRWTTPHYGEVIDAGRRALPNAEARLARLVDDATQPGIVRATALELLGQYLSPASLPSLQRAAGDADAIVRLAAAGVLESVPEDVRVSIGTRLLRDPVRGVRVEAVSAFASDVSRLDAESRTAFDAALVEYRAAQATNADRPEAWMNLGVLEARLGNRAAARRNYEEAMRVGPWLAASWVNLADLLREEGNDAEGERVLREGIARAATAADLHEALGLLLARQQRNDEALAELKAACDLEPRNTRFAYVLGVALHSGGRAGEALAVLERALEARPGDRDLLMALATMSRDAGDLSAARSYARRLAEASPGSAEARAFLESMEAQGRR